MSAGAFSLAKYKCDYNGTEVHPILIQPETLAAEAPDNITNAETSDAISNPISAVSSLGKNASGLRPRLITLKALGSVPTGYQAGSTTRIPALTPEFYNACLPGVIVEYLGVNWQVIGRSPESAK